jgi:hypothetical protein
MAPWPSPSDCQFLFHPHIASFVTQFDHSLHDTVLPERLPSPVPHQKPPDPGPKGRFGSASECGAEGYALHMVQTGVSDCEFNPFAESDPTAICDILHAQTKNLQK